MLTIKVYWGPHALDFPLYSVYSGNKYTVSGVENRDGSIADFKHLVIDDSVNIELGKGSRTYVMNSHGATIDTIIVN
jgi:hypothetical protein